MDLTVGQAIAEQTASYCSAMQAYDGLEFILKCLPDDLLKSKFIDSAGDPEYIASLEAMDRDEVITTLIELHCGKLVDEAAQALKALGVDMARLESVRRFGKKYPDIASRRFACFFVMPDNKPPLDDLSKIFEAGYITSTYVEKGTDDNGKEYTEYHPQPLAVMDLVKIINYFDMKFDRLDNSEYQDPENNELGDLVYKSSTGVEFTIFNMIEWGAAFTEWGPQLKELLYNACK